MSATPVTAPSRLEEETVRAAFPHHIATLLVPVAIYLSICASVLMIGTQISHGHFAYSLDDTYIHMAIAKNLALHGVYGVTPYETTSASSSILWPFLLAAFYKITGPAVLLPLLLQLPSAVAVLWLCWEILRKESAGSNLYVLLSLTVLVVLIPMSVMTLLGMEHMLQIAATLFFAYTAVRYLQESRPGLFPILLLSAMLNCSVRYEGAFLIASAALLLALKRKWLEAVAVSVAGVIPILLFGLYALAHGGYWLPNSVLLKRQPLGIKTVARLISLHACPPIFVLVCAALFFLAFTRPPRFSRDLLKLFLLTALLHQLLAEYGWFYRYEAYLIALGGIAIACAASYIAIERPIMVTTAVLIFAMPLAVRAIQSQWETPLAMRDIYRQQVQIAEFFRSYYPAGNIAINDIGAVSFFSEPHLLDLAGLGDNEIAQLRLHGTGTFDPSVLFRTRNIQVVAVYDSWFGLGSASIPPNWYKVGTWTLPEKVVVGDTTVSFYGVGLENARQLRTNLEAFRPNLPPEITVNQQ